MCRCQCVSQRYLVSILGFFGLVISVGYRADFSLVMTHVAKRNDNHTEREFFITCGVYNTSADWKTNWSESLVQDFHTVYFAGTLITQIPGGILSARFSPKRLCGIMILCSSVLFIVLPFLAMKHVAYVFVIRGLQGLLEGGSVPALAGVISAWAPKSQRTILLNIAYAGAYLSPAVGFIAAGMATCRITWDSIFFIAGGLGVVWFVVWMILVCETPDTCPHISERERALYPARGQMVAAAGRDVAQAIPWRKMLTSRPVFAIFVGAFCRNWIFSMLITQQPQYFKDSFKMNTANIGLYSAIPPVLMTVVVIAGGFFIDKIMEKELVGRTFGRKLAQTMGFGTEAVCIFCLYFVNDFKIALVLLCVGVGFSGFAISGYQVNALDLSPQYASLITGIGRIGTIGSIISTQLTGAVIGQNNSIGQWKKMWLTAGIIHFVGVIVYDIFASGNTQPWDPSLSSRAQFIIDSEEGKILGNCSAVSLPHCCEGDPLLAKPTDEKDSKGRAFEDSLSLGY